MTPSPRRGRRQQPRRGRRQPTPKKKNRLPFPSSPPIVFPAPVFPILPFSLWDPIVASHLYLTSTSVKNHQWFFSILKKSSPNSNPFLTPDVVSSLETAIFTIQSHRWRFRKLLHHWRFHHLKQTNTSDIVTGLPPKQPVWIVDWANKQKFVFEAQTLHKDITYRLYHHDGFFEDPQMPRNPYTNLPLTAYQILSVWNQLQSLPIAKSSPFTSFATSRWRLTRFSLEQAIPLQIHALRATMNRHQDEDQKDRLFDFIQQAYEHEAVDCAKDSIWHCICKHPDLPLLQKWRALCTKFYEAEILFSQSDRLYQEQEKIWDKTICLLELQKECVIQRNLDNRISRN